MSSFTDLGVAPNIVAGLKKHGFTEPTPIQAQTIPIILSGRDMIGQAETGSGKTLACSIPAIQRVDPANKAIQVLILAPTRELAIQYLNELALPAEHCGLVPFAVYGGFDKGIQRAKFKEGVQLLVATPGRLIDLIYNDYLPLDQVKMLIIDEGDEMLDMGFIDDIEFITQCLVQEHQTLLFSATMPPPIKRLASNYQTDPLHVVLNVDQVTPQSLDHLYINVGHHQKEQMLRKLINNETISQAIIFCNRRYRVSDLFDSLKQDIKQLEFLHGGLDQDLRTRIMSRFRTQRIKYIVTTDVMARGLDFKKVSHIIHFDLPEEPASYIHRSGRTARLGRRGLALAFVTPREQKQYDEIKNHADIDPQPLRPDFYKTTGSAGHAGKQRNNPKSQSRQHTGAPRRRRENRQSKPRNSKGSQ